MSAGIRSDASGTFGALQLNGADVFNFYPAKVSINGAAKPWTVTTSFDMGAVGLASSGPNVFFAANQYYDGAWKYKADGFSTLLYQTDGNFDFYNSPSGLAGAVATHTLRFRIEPNGNVVVKSPDGGLGYGTGAGGAVTQLTDKTTAVGLNKPCGKITMANSAIPSGVTVQFSLINNLVDADTTMVISLDANGLSAVANYTVKHAVSAGVVFIGLTNNSGGSLSETVRINFAIIKGVTS